jgi:hypothetical protein
MSDWGFVFIAVIAAASMLVVFNWRRSGCADAHSGHPQAD